MPFLPDALRVPWNRVPAKAAPSTNMLFPKSDNNWYSRDSTGVDTIVGGTGKQTTVTNGTNVDASQTEVFRDGRTVTLSIEFTTSAAIPINSILFTIPLGYQPTKRNFPFVMAAGVVHLLQVNPDGNVFNIGGALTSGLQHLGAGSYFGAL